MCNLKDTLIPQHRSAITDTGQRSDCRWLRYPVVVLLAPTAWLQATGSVMTVPFRLQYVTVRGSSSARVMSIVCSSGSGGAGRH
jgi:hypothetical protein